ncbi:MAG: LysR family transcriptional regulator [Bauldia sp.]|nr:LysR family transcriptional regulator [Bauldia sp.]
MDRLAAMRTLVQVIDAGSFSGAARHLRVGQPAISKTINRLEAELGVRLIARTTRGLSATDAGQRFYERAVRAIEEADEAEIAARNADTGLSGRLRVSMPVTFGRMHVIPLMPDFLALHPALQLDLVMDDQTTDLVEEGVDLALRLGPQPDSSLAGRTIASRRRVVVGTPAYFALSGTPEHPSDLERHEAIVLSIERGPLAWTFARRAESVRIAPSGRVRVSAAEGVRAAVLAGLGYTIGSEWGFGRDLAEGRVREVLTAWSLPPVDLWALYPGGRQASARARAFVAFVAGRLRKE